MLPHFAIAAMTMRSGESMPPVCAAFKMLSCNLAIVSVVSFFLFSSLGGGVYASCMLRFGGARCRCDVCLHAACMFGVVVDARACLLCVCVCVCFVLCVSRSVPLWSVWHLLILPTLSLFSLSFFLLSLFLSFLLCLSSGNGNNSPKEKHTDSDPKAR